MEQAIMATGVVLVGLQAVHLIIHTIHFIQTQRKLNKIMKTIPEPVTYEEMERDFQFSEDWRDDWRVTK